MSMTRDNFDGVITNIGAYETRINNYLIEASLDAEKPTDFLAFQEPDVELRQPGKSAVWEFLDKDKLKHFMDLKDGIKVRKFIEKKLKSNPRGLAKAIYVDLMYNVWKFCKAANFNLEKSGAVLSQFYLTHKYFTSRLNVSPEKVFKYFQDMMYCHSFPFVLQCTKVFQPIETTEIMAYFCKLYLRNLPLIRFLSLPNFAFQLDLHLEPEPDFSQMKKSKKKEKNGKKPKNEKPEKGEKKKKKK